MNRRSAIVLSAALTVFLSGCSGSFRLPWEDDLLDPDRVVTREPLEVPPNLHVLPPPANPDSANAQAGGEQEEEGGTDAATILFGSPRTESAAPLNRSQREQLPDWMDPESSPSNANP